MLEAFDCYTPGSRRLYHFEFHNEERQLTQELRRTLDAIAAAAPAKIAKGQLTLHDATHQATLWLAIVEDLERGPGNLTDKPACSCGCLRQFKTAANGVAWKDKVVALRREIRARRGGYPSEIDKGRLTRDQAKEQLERLEAVHDLYWRHCFAFDGTRDELRQLGAVAMSKPLEQEQAA